MSGHRREWAGAAHVAGLTRRQALAAAAAGAGAALLGASPAVARSALRLDFSSGPAGDGWGNSWTTVGVANLRRANGEGVLEAGSDVFPNDPRPVAFAADSRLRDAEIRALITHVGYAPGVVLRRVAHRHYYAAIYDTERKILLIVRRRQHELLELVHEAVAFARPPVTLALEARGVAPTRLTARLVDANGHAVETSASDSTVALQKAGEPGVLATAQTFLTTPADALAPLGNVRLGFLGTQEGTAVVGSPAGQTYVEAVRDRSTVRLREIVVDSAERARPSPASVVAATTSVPLRGGAQLNVATDLAADVRVELSGSPRFARSRTVLAGRTGSFAAVNVPVRRLRTGRRVYWRARVRRAGTERIGPTRSFRILPGLGDPAAVRLAVGACATRFGPNFDHIAARRPDVFVWQGDLNYPDTHGPLAQTVSGYAGIWRDLLGNPRTVPILARTAFAPQRDDHDYGIQDANRTRLLPWGLTPWESLINNRRYYRFAAGMVEVWVLDERLAKSPPEVPDTAAKTLLGAEQRRWLLRTLARSRAPFKIICSPCTLYYGDNARDGNWAAGFTAERELLLDHIRRRVSGRTIFLTGDAHDTMVYDRGGVFEARACPLDIPDPRDHPGVQAGMIGGEGVAYWALESHFTLVEARGRGPRAVMTVTLVREDGKERYRKSFEARIPRSLRPRRHRPPRRRPRFTG